MNHRTRLWLLGILAVAMLLLAAIMPPIPQPAEYHQFADRRSYFGIPNFFDVISNIAFLFVGFAGLAFLLQPHGPHSSGIFVTLPERWPYLILFLSMLAAGFGSAYYHWQPDNERLVWDRLPMAAGFMALLAAVLTERINPRVGLQLLPFLLAAGIGSVLHWHWSEQAAAGNLNFYLVVQFCSLLLVLLLVTFFPPRYSHGMDIYGAIAWYGLAKLAELADQEIYAVGQLISGHTLKHLLAALAVYWILRMLRKRRPLPEKI
ncbi:MAG: alkaline phytoceramidase [Nitrosospira sp.]|nr:alkaline phytoceramidase [Nitrosospira sp.]